MFANMAYKQHRFLRAWFAALLAGPFFIWGCTSYDERIREIAIEEQNRAIMRELLIRQIAEQEEQQHPPARRR